jgi:hypothetical protein
MSHAGCLISHGESLADRCLGEHMADMSNNESTLELESTLFKSRGYKMWKYLTWNSFLFRW